MSLHLTKSLRHIYQDSGDYTDRDPKRKPLKTYFATKVLCSHTRDVDSLIPKFIWRWLYWAAESKGRYTQ